MWQYSWNLRGGFKHWVFEEIMSLLAAILGAKIVLCLCKKKNSFLLFLCSFLGVYRLNDMVSWIWFKHFWTLGEVGGWYK